MKSRIILIAIALLAVFLTTILLAVKPMPIPRSTFKLTGQAGLAFKATIKADGVEMTFSGTLPTELQVTGHSIDCSFRKLQPDGSITLNVVTPDGSGGSVGTAEPHGGVRAVVYRKLLVSKCVVTTF